MFIHASNLESSQSSSTTESSSEKNHIEFNYEKSTLEGKILRVKKSYIGNNVIKWGDENLNKIPKENNSKQCTENLSNKFSNYSSL